MLLLVDFYFEAVNNVGNYMLEIILWKIIYFQGTYFVQ
jgi:hypothetical protein